MAFSKKGCRRIVVDGHAFRWKVRHRLSYAQGLGWRGLVVAVELTAGVGAGLIVNLARPHPSNWLNEPTTPVLPCDVATYIRQAQEQGWNPTRRGRLFRLESQ